MRLLLLVYLTIGLINCSIYQNNQTGAITGALGGGMLGGLIGEGTVKMVAVGTHALAGMVGGGGLGLVIDYPLARKLNTTLYYNQINQTSYWTDSGAVYLLTPTSDLMNINDIPACRRYHLAKIVKKIVEEEQGVVCLQANETWKVLVATKEPGVGLYRDLAQYHKIFEVLQTTTPARQPVLTVKDLQGY